MDKQTPGEVQQQAPRDVQQQTPGDVHQQTPGDVQQQTPGDVQQQTPGNNMAKQVDLLLIGKTGNGKSSTGNSILGREAFTESDGAISETFAVQKAFCRFQERTVKIVDTPGLSDTSLSDGDAAKKLTKDMYEAVMQCPEGIHALVLVLKYGGRFTEEDGQTLNSLKAIFGETFVKDFCILVFTCGDNFDSCHRRKPKLFLDWLNEQVGPLKALFLECNKRAVLFRNHSEDKYESQLAELLSLVDGLQLNGARYTNILFKSFAKERELLIVKQNAPELRKNIQIKIDSLDSSYKEIQSATDLNADTKSKLEALKKDARDLDVEIAVTDKGTGVLGSLAQVLGRLRQTLDDKQSSLVEKMAHCAQIEKMTEENNDKMKQVRTDLEQRLEKMVTENKNVMEKFKNRESKTESLSKEIIEYQEKLEQRRCFIQRGERYCKWPLGGSYIDRRPGDYHCVPLDLEIGGIDFFVMSYGPHTTISGMIIKYRREGETSTTEEVTFGATCGEHITGTQRMRLDQGEYIVKVQVICGHMIGALKITTNKGWEKKWGGFGSDSNEAEPFQTGRMSYLHDIICETDTHRGNEFIMNLMLGWKTFY